MLQQLSMLVPDGWQPCVRTVPAEDWRCTRILQSFNLLDTVTISKPGFWLWISKFWMF